MIPATVATSQRRPVIDADAVTRARSVLVMPTRTGVVESIGVMNALTLADEAGENTSIVTVDSEAPEDLATVSEKRK